MRPASMAGAPEEERRGFVEDAGLRRATRSLTPSPVAIRWLRDLFERGDGVVLLVVPHRCEEREWHRVSRSAAYATGNDQARSHTSIGNSPAVLLHVSPGRVAIPLAAMYRVPPSRGGSLIRPPPGVCAVPGHVALVPMRVLGMARAAAASHAIPLSASYLLAGSLQAVEDLSGPTG